MADKKISALTGASTPLAGTEVLPIVQSGATVKVAVSDLTAGRAISATQLTLTTGNVIVASGQGIDFSATPGTGTSELFADYEEGTWTGTIIGSTTAGTASYAARTGNYTKVGNVVHFDIYLSWSAGTGTGNLLISGLPFTSKSGDSYGEVSIGDFNNVTLIALNVATARTNPSSTQIIFNQYPTGGGAVNAVAYDAAGYVVLGGFYFV